MKRFVMFAASLVLSVSMAACAIAGASEEYPSTKIRYKMTVEVDTPEGVKTGSAVREISMVSRPKRMGEMNDTHVKLEKGEAVVIDLGQRGVLFALMGIGDHAIQAFFNAIPSGCPEGAVSRCSIRYYKSLSKSATSKLAEKNYPMLVTFKNRYDLNSLAVASKYESEDMPDGYGGVAHSLTSLFGNGVKISSIIIELTDQEPEFIIDQWLPWLSQIGGKYLHGGAALKGAPYSLHGGNFQVRGN